METRCKKQVDRLCGQQIKVELPREDEGVGQDKPITCKEPLPSFSLLPAYSYGEAWRRTRNGGGRRGMQLIGFLLETAIILFAVAVVKTRMDRSAGGYRSVCAGWFFCNPFSASSSR